MTDTSHPQTLRSLTDLVEVVPTFLGFHPTESVVVISIEAGSVVLTARVDLDLPGGHGTAAALRAVWRKVPHGDHIVIAYSDDPDRAWWALDDVADAMPGTAGAPCCTPTASGGTRTLTTAGRRTTGSAASISPAPPMTDARCATPAPSWPGWWSRPGHRPR